MLESGEKVEILLKNLAQEYDDKTAQSTATLLLELPILAQSYEE